FIAVNYGKMSVEAANLGWIAQHEFCFSIPMEWYRVEDSGEWVFQDWAYVSPFIWVDNELSLTTGREVFGWPKTMAVLGAGTGTWMENPRARPRLASLCMEVGRDGERREVRPFLEIDVAPPPSPTQVPADLDGPFTPWTVMTNTVTTSLSLVRDYYDLLAGLGLTRR